jgi:hypothetical protein
VHCCLLSALGATHPWTRGTNPTTLVTLAHACCRPWWTGAAAGAQTSRCDVQEQRVCCCFTAAISPTARTHCRVPHHDRHWQGPQQSTNTTRGAAASHTPACACTPSLNVTHPSHTRTLVGCRFHCCCLRYALPAATGRRAAHAHTCCASTGCGQAALTNRSTRSTELRRNRAARAHTHNAVVGPDSSPTLRTQAGAAANMRRDRRPPPNPGVSAQGAVRPSQWGQTTRAAHSSCNSRSRSRSTGGQQTLQFGVHRVSRATAHPDMTMAAIREDAGLHTHTRTHASKHSPRPHTLRTPHS